MNKTFAVTALSSIFHAAVGLASGLATNSPVNGFIGMAVSSAAGMAIGGVISNYVLKEKTAADGILLGSLATSCVAPPCAIAAALIT